MPGILALTSDHYAAVILELQRRPRLIPRTMA
jgi:hypothetical protein